MEYALTISERERLMKDFAEWKGDQESPFKDGVKVKVRYRGYPRRPDDVLNAWMYPKSGWIHNGSHRDIVQFKVVGA